MADAVESGGRARLVSELGRVQDLVRQLELQLRAPADAASVDLCRRLVHQIVALTDRSIGMLHSSPDLAPSPLSATGSPISSDAASDHHNHPFRPAASPKKRKATARWTSQQVRVSAAGGGGSGAEGPADDGHSWRKYGQKDILGAKHPRAYYRCTHRNSQNCPATKQVQRTDDHPALFDVVYHGEHTCRPAAAGGAKRAQQHNPHAQAALQGLAARLTVATTTKDAAAIGAAALPPMTPESCPARGASSPWSLASPVGSDSNGCLHQGVSPCPVPGYRDWASEGDLQEVVSSAFAAVSSAAPLPVLDDEFMSLECFGFDHTFDIDTAMPSLYYP